MTDRSRKHFWRGWLANLAPIPVQEWLAIFLNVCTKDDLLCPDSLRSAGHSGGGIPSVSYSFSYSQIIISDLVAGTSVTYYWTPPLTSAPETANKGILLTPTPNPTHGQTQFSFSLPADSNAQLTLYDIRGYRVRELHSGWTSSEPTVAVWDGTDENGMTVAQGVYVARLVYPGYQVTQRLTVLR